jgi:hypothetical protein
LLSGAAIAADRKKKSEKDSDEMCEAKVDEKLPEYERATARDREVAASLPGSGTRRVRRSNTKIEEVSRKRWWDDDGDGIGWEKGEVKKEEVEQIGELFAIKKSPKDNKEREVAELVTLMKQQKIHFPMLHLDVKK